MVININPNRINVRTGVAGGAPERQARDAETTVYKAPQRSEINHIPAPESLATLIRSAVSAIRNGVFWDRGTILNLLV